MFEMPGVNANTLKLRLLTVCGKPPQWATAQCLSERRGWRCIRNQRRGMGWASCKHRPPSKWTAARAAHRVAPKLAPAWRHQPLSLIEGLWLSERTVSTLCTRDKATLPGPREACDAQSCTVIPRSMAKGGYRHLATHDCVSCERGLLPSRPYRLPAVVVSRTRDSVE